MLHAKNNSFIRSFIRVWVKYKKEHLENHYNVFSSQRKMNCLHGQPAATSTTQNGSFWFCNQNPSCNFFCSEDEGYLFEKAIDAWKSTKQTHPKCTKHQKLAKMRVVKDLMKPNGQLACYQSIMGKMVTFTCARNGRRGASILHVRNTVYF